MKGKAYCDFGHGIHHRLNLSCYGFLAYPVLFGNWDLLVYFSGMQRFLKWRRSASNSEGIAQISCLNLFLGSSLQNRGRS
jgi:hypothetical protein